MLYHFHPTFFQNPFYCSANSSFVSGSYYFLVSFSLKLKKNSPKCYGTTFNKIRYIAKIITSKLLSTILSKPIVSPIFWIPYKNCKIKETATIYPLNITPLKADSQTHIFATFASLVCFLSSDLKIVLESIKQIRLIK